MRVRIAPFVLVLTLGFSLVPGRAAPAAPAMTLAGRADCAARIDAVLAAARGRPGASLETSHARALDAVRASNALARLWNAPITAAALDAELARIEGATKDPALWTAMRRAAGTDAAECVARPMLAQRLLRDAFVHDHRIHGATVSAARRAILAAPGVDALRALAPEASLRRFVRASASGPVRADRGAWALAPSEWDAVVGGAVATPDVAALRDVGDAYALDVLTSERSGRAEVLRLSWPKVGFDSWWRSAAPAMGSRLDEPTRIGARAPASTPAAGGSPPAHEAPSGSSPAHDASSRSAPAGDASSCAPGEWSPIAGGPPAPRKWHTMVWTGREAIVWGGAGGSIGGTGSNTGGRYDPATDTWSPTSTVGAPDARFLHTAAWTGSEMFVWGGQKGIPAQQMTARGGLYDPVADTWRPVKSFGGPPATLGQTATWTGERIVLLGGSSPTVWLYDPASDTWSTTASPRGLLNHRSVWTGTHVLAWGGTNSGAPNPVGLSYHPASDTWRILPPAPLEPRSVNFTAVWAGAEMVVWGGGTQTSASVPGTGAAYDPETDRWRPVSLVGAPSSRAGHVAAAVGGEMIVWGGRSAAGLVERYSFPDGGRYDPRTDSWRPLEPFAFTAGGGTFDGAAVSTGSTMMVFGGEHGQVEQAIGGRYDPASGSWIAMGAAAAPSGRGAHRPVWTGAELFVWGGGAGFPTRDGRRYLPAVDVWLPVSSNGAPSARDVHEAVWTGREAIVWSGFSEAWSSGAEALPRSGARYDPASDTWRAMSEAGAPAGRFWGASAWTGSELFVWGGYDGAVDRADGGLYDPDLDRWRAVSAAGLQGRSEHEIAWDGSRAIVWGGFPGLNTGSRYDPATDTWAATTTAGAPTVRYRFSAVSLDGKMIVWGGQGAGYRSDGGVYDPALDTWTALPPGPAGVFMHRGTAAAGRMIVWGGYGGSATNHGGVFDPASRTWAATTVAGAPSPRYFHAQAWTGGGLLIWGGNPIQGTGAFLCA